MTIFLMNSRISDNIKCETEALEAFVFMLMWYTALAKKLFMKFIFTNADKIYAYRRK